MFYSKILDQLTLQSHTNAYAYINDIFHKPHIEPVLSKC